MPLVKIISSHASTTSTITLMIFFNYIFCVLMFGSYKSDDIICQAARASNYAPNCEPICEKVMFMYSFESIQAIVCKSRVSLHFNRFCGLFNFKI